MYKKCTPLLILFGNNVNHYRLVTEKFTESENAFTIRIQCITNPVRASTMSILNVNYNFVFKLKYCRKRDLNGSLLRYII